MEKILDFKNRSAHPFHLSFNGGNIYIATEYNKDLFEPSVFHSLLKYKIAMEYVQTLHLAIGILEELKLNQNYGVNYENEIITCGTLCYIKPQCNYSW